MNYVFLTGFITYTLFRRTLLLFIISLLKRFIYRRVNAPYKFSLVQQLMSHLPRIRSWQQILILSGKFPSSKVTCLQEKSSQKKNLAYLTDFLVEETFSPIANITGWTFTGLQTVGFLFVNICSKLSTINEYFQTPTFSINEHCSRLSLKCHLPQYHQVIPHQ